MRKRNPNAKLFHQLDEGQQAQLAEWLLSGMPYHKAQEALLAEFKLKVGASALSQFWQDACVPLLLARRSRAVQTAKEIGEDARSRPGQFNAATVDLLEQKALELAISPQVDPKDVKAIYTLVLKARDQSLEERRITILEKKAKQAEEAEKTLGDSKLTAEEREQRMRQIFGLS